MKVLVLGATGRIGSKLVKNLNELNDVQIKVYVRTPEKITEKMDIEVIKGDILDSNHLREAMQDINMVIAAVDGNLLEMSKSIVSAAENTSVSRIVWVTGMGIHHEVPGLTGKMLDMLVKAQPEYVEAADLIMNSGLNYTLVRAAHLTDGNNEKYHLQNEGEKLHSNSVDRCAVARFIADMVLNEELGKNESLGITN
ncbi:MAG: SDR family oxidoreductase [Clostridia bacterium]|nr:SDR family oxidoreductase [Clostridia bacterium]